MMTVPDSPEVPQPRYDAVHRVIERIFSIDLRSLALFRVGLALTLLFDLFIRLTDLRIFYPDSGVMPRSQVIADSQIHGAASLFFVNGFTAVQVALFAVAIAAALSLLIGYRTRLATLLSWVFLISLHTRAPLVTEGDDLVRRVLLFWGLFLPLGACYSVDATLGREDTSQPPPQRICSWGTVALFLQVCMIYWFSGLEKTSPVWHSEGSGLYYALSLDMFTAPAAKVLLAHPYLLRLMSHATVPFEIFAPFLLFSPVFNSQLRLLVIASFIAFHLGIAISFTIAIFSATCIVAWLALLPSSFWEWSAKRTARRRAAQRQWHIYYDGECGFCRRMLALWQTFLALPRAMASPAQNDPTLWEDMQQRNSWIVTDPEGHRYYEFNALARLCGTTPVVGWIFLAGTWPPFSTVGNGIYKWVAAHRDKLGRTQASLQPESPRISRSKVHGAVIVFCLLYGAAWNLRAIYPKRITPFFPHRVDNIGVLFRLDQHWGMFAPFPLINDGWWVITGEQRNGRTVDLLHDTDRVNWSKPDNLGISFRNYRWRQYFTALALSGYARYRGYYADYLGRTWNQSHRREEGLKSISMFFIVEETLPQGEAKPFSTLFYRGDCGPNSPSMRTVTFPVGNIPVGNDLPASALRNVKPVREGQNGTIIPSIPRTIVLKSPIAVKPY